MTLSQYNALKIHDENTLYVVTVNGGTAVYKEPPSEPDNYYHDPHTVAELFSAEGLFSAPERAGFDLLLGEKSVDLSMGGVQFHTYKTEDYTFSWFHDSWAMPTEEEYEQLMKDGMIPENWPFASLEEELEARSKVRLDGFGWGVSGTYADSTMTMKITNSTSERFKITFDPQARKYSENARSIGITLPRALEKTDALIIDGVKKKAYIEAENGKKTYVSDAVNWDEWKTLLGTTNVFCDEGEGDITVSVRKALVRDSSGRINDWGFAALYLE